MKYITRFNPNVNGLLHLGHIYTALVNQYYAHERSGKFIVRFDDTNRDTAKDPAQRQRIIQSQKEDLEWLGIKADQYIFQSDQRFEVLNILSKSKLQLELEDSSTPELPDFIRMRGSSWIPMPFTPQMTSERVVFDCLIGTTHVIRGEEFATEYSYYHYCCNILGITPPRMIFLPRLMDFWGSDISKTIGGNTVANYRLLGYKPSDVLDLLSVSCLYWRYNPWELGNLKPNPRLIQKG
jgi:glutamyl/glutaminyl-tRNA synthetase